MATKRTASDILAENRKRLAMEADLYPIQLGTDENPISCSIQSDEQEWPEQDITAMQDAYNKHWYSNSNQQYASGSASSVYQTPYYPAATRIGHNRDIDNYSRTVMVNRVRRMTVSGQTNDHAVTIRPAAEIRQDDPSGNYIAYANNNCSPNQWRYGNDLCGGVVYEDISGNTKNPHYIAQYSENNVECNQSYDRCYPTSRTFSGGAITPAQLREGDNRPDHTIDNRQQSECIFVAATDGHYSQDQCKTNIDPNYNLAYNYGRIYSDKCDHRSRQSDISKPQQERQDHCRRDRRSCERSEDIYEYDDRVYQTDVVDINNNTVPCMDQQQTRILPDKTPQQETFITIENAEVCYNSESQPTTISRPDNYGNYRSVGEHADQTSLGVLDNSSGKRSIHIQEPPKGDRISSTGARITPFNRRRIGKRGRPPSNKQRHPQVDTNRRVNMANELMSKKMQPHLLLQGVHGECDIRKPVISSYIDQLILENELITEMSDTYTPATSLCLPYEDYVRISFSIPAVFPTPKFRKWFSTFLPHLNIESIYTDPGGDIDSKRPCSRFGSLEEFISDTFYGCRRELSQRKARNLHSSQKPDVLAVPTTSSTIPIPRLSYSVEET